MKGATIDFKGNELYYLLILKFEPANLIMPLISQWIHKHILGWERSQSFMYGMSGLPRYLKNIINLSCFSCKPKAKKNIGLIAREWF